MPSAPKAPLSKTVVVWFSVVLSIAGLVWSTAVAHSQIETNKTEISKAEVDRKKLEEKVAAQKQESTDRLARNEEKLKSIEKTTDRIEKKLDKVLERKD